MISSDLFNYLDTYSNEKFFLIGNIVINRITLYWREYYQFEYRKTIYLIANSEKVFLKDEAYIYISNEVRKLLRKRKIDKFLKSNFNI